MAHGHTNSTQPGQLSRSDEQAMIENVKERLTNATGTAPKGYLAPLISESVHTPDLLDEAGYEYLLDWAHDEQPVWFDTQAKNGTGRILSLPYPQELNDVPQIMGRRREAAEFAEMILSAFDLHQRECASRPVVIGDCAASLSNGTGTSFRAFRTRFTGHKRTGGFPNMVHNDGRD